MSKRRVREGGGSVAFPPFLILELFLEVDGWRNDSLL